MDLLLLSSVASVAVVHTLIGVDHYLPFVVVGRAERWSLARVLGVTAVCGLAHLAGSVVLGLAGVGLGVAAGQLAWIEEVRGGLAAWALIAFGLTVMSWAIWRRVRAAHRGELLAAPRSASFWTLFAIFVLGPCEPLIPLMLAPAAAQDWSMVAMVVATFTAVTLVAMCGAVALGFSGLRWKALERHADVFAGASIAAAGLAIQVLGI